MLRRPRQVLIAGSFAKQVTHTVVWLSEMNLDIDLVQVSMWRVGNQVVAGFTKIYPTPEAEEFTLAPAREEAGAVAQRVHARTRAKNVVHVLVEAKLLPDGTRLRLVPSHGATEKIREAITGWTDEDPRRAAVSWQNSRSRPLRWDVDQQEYSPTGLAEKVLAAVTGEKAEGVQGTTWWVVDGDHIPEDVDPAEWAVLSGRTLVDIAGDVKAAPRDWTDLHDLLAALPAGWWTTYGDVAANIGCHPVPLGRHLATCTACPSAWRVLNVHGRVSPGFHWPDGREEKVEDVLANEGVMFTDGVADPTRRVGRDKLQELLDQRQEA